MVLGLKYIFYGQVAKDPSGINALEQHIKNLLCPSTPFFFNTLYDPYREGANFVCGYPFILRHGTPTTISHGLWMNIPNYDAPTQLEEEIIPFFQSATLPKDCVIIQQCYIELSKQVKDKLGKIDPYFLKLADATVTWIDAWDELNPSSKAESAVPNGWAKLTK
eukprot:Gb_40317 [translate_table: standard]